MHTGWHDDLASLPAVRPISILLLLWLHTAGAYAQNLAAPNAIPLFFTDIPRHLFATQFNFSAGTGRLTRSDKPLFSASGEVKGIYNITGALYVSSGAGFSYLHSQDRAPLGEESMKRDAWLFYLPTGIGFTMGDDHASFITGIDALPGFYTDEHPELRRQRRFAFGIGPEFGFLFRVGPRCSKGLLIGMVGKLQFMQLPDLDDGAPLRYTFGGLGLVVRFY